MLRGFQPVPGLRQAAAPGHRAVVGQQQGVVIPAVGGDGVRNPLGAWGLIVHAGHGSQIYEGLRIDRQIQAHPRDGKAGADRRMRVAHRLRLRVLLIDAQMHLHLAGGAPVPLGNHRPVQPHLHHHVLRHEALADPRRRGPENIVVHLDRDVPVVGRHEVLVIHAAPDLHDHPFRFFVRRILAQHHFPGSFPGFQKNPLPQQFKIINIITKQFRRVYYIVHPPGCQQGFLVF